VLTKSAEEPILDAHFQDWSVGSLAIGPKTKTIPNREVISGLILNRDHAENWGFIFATTCYTA